MATVGESDLRAAAAALRLLEAEDGADGSRPGSPAGGAGGPDDESEEDGGGTPLAPPPAAPVVAPIPPPFLPGATAATGGAPAAPASGVSAADALFGASVDALLAEAPRGRGGRRSSKRPRGGGSGGGEDGRKRRTDLPRHLQPLMGAATLAYLHGRLPDAVATLRRVITEAPKAPAPYRTLALIARERGDAARALNLSLLAAHLSPRDVGVWKDLAGDSVAAGRVDQAVYCLGMALKASNGKDVGALSARAELYARVGNAKRAAEAYARLAAAVPVHPAVAVRLATLASSYSNGYRAVAGVSGVLRRLESGGVLGEPFGLWEPPPPPPAAPPSLPVSATAATEGDDIDATAAAAAAAADDPRSRELWRWKLIRILARLLARTRQWGAAAALLSRVGMQVGAGEISTSMDEEGVRAVAAAEAAAAAAAAAAPIGVDGATSPQPPSAGSTATAGGEALAASAAGDGAAAASAADDSGTRASVGSAAESACARARGAAVGATAAQPSTPAVPSARPVMALDLRVRLATCHVRLHSPALATRAVSELLAHPAPAATHTEVVWDLAEAYRSVGDMDQALFFYGLLDALPAFEYASTLHFHMSRCRRLALGRDTDIAVGRGAVVAVGHVVAAGASPAVAVAGAVGDNFGLGDVPFALPPAPSNRPLLTTAQRAAAAAAAAVVGGPDDRGTKRPQPGADGAAADSLAAAAGTPVGSMSVTAAVGPVATEGPCRVAPDASHDMEASQAGALAALHAAEAAATADDEAGPPAGLASVGLTATPWAVRATDGPAGGPPRASGLATLFDTPLATDGASVLPPGSGVSMPYRRPRKPYTPAGSGGGAAGAPTPGVELSPSFRQRATSAAGLPNRPSTGDAAGGGGSGPSWAPSYNSRSVTAAGAAAGVREVLAAADEWYDAGFPVRYLAAVAPLVELTAGVVRGFLPRHALGGGLCGRTGATHDEEVDAALRAAVASYASSPHAAAASSGSGVQGAAASAGSSVLATDAVEACVPMEGVVASRAGEAARGGVDGAPSASAASAAMSAAPSGAAGATSGDAQPPSSAAGGTPAPARTPAAASPHPDRWSWRKLWWRNGRRAFGVAHVSRAVTTVLDEAAFVRLTERLLAAAAAIHILPAAAAVARKLASQRRFLGRTRAARMRLLAAVAAVVLHRPAVAATELRGLIGERPHAAGLWRVFLDSEALASGRDVLEQPVTRFMTRLVSKEPDATPLGLLMGHESAAAGSHGYALAHYASVARAAPRCALVALCMGVQYLQAALSRRTRNRNEQVLRAFVHLNRYRELRVAGAGGYETGVGEDDAPAATAGPVAPIGLRAAVVAAEADYNVGRGFHMMGLLHLAVPLYRRVLAAPLPSTVTEADGGGGGRGLPPQSWLDVRRDAAFNLAAIYTSVPGNEAVAVAETREVLTF